MTNVRSGAFLPPPSLFSRIMFDPAAGQAGGGSTTAAAPAAGAASADAPKFVTVEQFSALQSTINGLAQTVQTLAKPAAAPATKPAAAAPAAGEPNELGLSDRLKLAENQLAEAARERRMNAIVSAANANRIPESRLDFLAFKLDKNLGERIVVENGRAVVKDPNGAASEPLPLTKYLEQFLTTTEGDVFRPAPAAAHLPSPGSGGRPSGNQKTITRAQFQTGKFNPADLADAVIVD